MLGGSRPWQAPEFSRTAYFRIEDAKRTDVYSFGMLLWRVFLDGDPFKSLGDIEGKTPKEKRQSRNEAIAALKEAGTLCILSKISYFDLILSPETCLGSFCSADVSWSSVVFLRREILTPKSLRPACTTRLCFSSAIREL